MLKHWQPQEKEEWNKKVAQSKDGGFLQSWQWGEFQEKLGNGVYNVSNQEESILAQALIMKAGSQFIMYLPRGPVTPLHCNAASPTSDDNAASPQIKKFLSDLKTFAKEKGCFMLRFDPAWGNDPVDAHCNARLREVAPKAPRERQPVHTLILDTNPTEEELLKNMKSKWRYNIRVGEKKGLEFKWSDNPQDAKMFVKLMNQTTARQGFASYDEEYFKTMMETLGETGNLKFLFAEYKARIIAGLVVVFFGNTAIYLHGASDYEFRNLMAPHFLQWEAIKEAKKQGMNYDFWGVATNPPSNKQEEHWGGITKFKTGFAPDTQITEYIGTYEMSVKKLYYLAYKLRQKIK